MTADGTAPPTETDREPHPAMYDMERDDFLAMVRYHGANEVLDAVLAVAVEVYGNTATAVERCHTTFLLRAEHLLVPPVTGGLE